MNQIDARKTDIALNDKNDIDINKSIGSLNTVQGKRELEQKITNLLNINRGEIDWNRNLGLNQYEILLNNGNSALLESEVSHYLKQVFGDSLQSCKLINSQVNQATRTKYVKFQVAFNSKHGEIEVSPDLMIGGK